MSKIHKPSDKSSGVLKMFGHVSLSWGWFLIAVVAPLLWGLLPIGYGVVNSYVEPLGVDQVSVIKNQPMFTVFVRSALASGVTAAVLLVWSLGVWVAGRCGIAVGWYWDIFKSMWRLLSQQKRKMWWLLALPLGYFVARWMEMQCVLGYKEGVSGDAALQKYGYFMGLMLVVLFPKNIIEFFTKRARWHDFSLVEILVWICTGVVVVASGLLYVCSYDAVNVWPYMWGISGLAVLVAVACSFYTAAKTFGNIAVARSGKPNAAAFLAALIMNVVMCCGTMLLALGAGTYMGWFSGIGEHSFADFWNLYVAGWRNPGFNRAFLESNGFWMVWVVVVLATVVAPVCQFAGVTKHNDALQKRKLLNYGITGSDWLVVCGGFEPLFVVILGAVLVPIIGAFDQSFAERISGLPLKNWWTISMAFGLVGCIALLRVIKIWSEKSSTLRNAIFTQIRGSARGPVAGLTSDELKERAKALICLKFYDKRRELCGVQAELRVSAPAELSNFSAHQAAAAFLDDCKNGRKMNVDMAGKGYYAVVLLHAGDVFFTQNDPFTRNVLSAQFDWLKLVCPEVSVTSCSDVLKPYCHKGSNPSQVWKVPVQDANSDEMPKGLKHLVCGGDAAATPFLLSAGDEKQAKSFCEKWNSLLNDVKSLLEKEFLSNYVNRLIVCYDSDREKCQVGI